MSPAFSEVVNISVSDDGFLSAEGSFQAECSLSGGSAILYVHADNRCWDFQNQWHGRVS